MERRPTVLIAIPLLLGILLQSKFNLKSIYILCLILFVFFIMLFTIIVHKKHYIIFIITILFILVGSLTMSLNDKGSRSLEAFEEENVKIVGDAVKVKINDEQEYYLYGKHLIFKGKKYNINDKILLKVFNDLKININNKRITVSGVLRKPTSRRNPKVFDYQLYLKTKGIYYLIHAKEQTIKVLDSGEISFLIKERYHLKNYIYNKVGNIMSGNEGKIALSIVFGDKNILDEELYKYFRISGIAHILAVSGLHFGILYLFINSLLNKLLLNEKLKTLILTIIIWGFAFIVGFTPSALRASAMITLYLVGNILNRKYDMFSSLYVVIISTLIINPFMAFDIAFQLSFIAVASIGLFYKPLYDKIKYIPDFFRKLISISIASQLGIIPIIAFHFNNISTLGIIFNIPAIFLMGYILPITLLLFLSLFISIDLAIYISYIDRILIKLLILVSKSSSFIPYNNIYVKSPKIHFFIIYYIILICIFYKEKLKFLNKYRKRSILIVCLAIYLIIDLSLFIIPEKLKVTFVDVGQGDCVLIETPRHKKILIDGGKKTKTDLLTSFLLKNHISEIDILILSHIHSDHIGGIIEVMDNLKVGQVIIGTDNFISEDYIRFKSIATQNLIDIIQIDQGKMLSIEDNLTIKALYPTSKIIKNTRDDINNNSLVMILNYKEFNVLFTGDIEISAEGEIIKKYKPWDVDVIKVAHHGSKTSSSIEFLRNFDPEIAVIQVGKNYFGHPHHSTLKKLNNENIRIYRNDRDGAVIIKSDGNNIKISTML